MDNYLNGYLEVLPPYQRQRIEEILEENRSLYGINEVTEGAFRHLISELAKNRQPASSMVPQIDRLDPELYNTYKMNTHIDLNALFLETLMIESAVENFESIFDGILSELEQSVNALRERVDGMKTIKAGEFGISVQKESFESKNSMANERRYANLFVDRDGSPVKPARYERQHDQYFITLPKTKQVDAIRPNGVPTAKIEVADRRGRPVQMNDTSERYQLENVLDGNPNTYWAEVILVDAPIKSPMKKD